MHSLFAVIAILSILQNIFILFNPDFIYDVKRRCEVTILHRLMFHLIHLNANLAEVSTEIVNYNVVVLV